MSYVLLRVASFVCIIVAGVVASSRGWVGGEAKDAVSKVVFNLTLPCAVIHAFGSAEFSPHMLLFVLVGFLGAAIPFALSVVLTRGSERATRLFWILNLCGYNIGCFSLPFVQAFFPPEQAVVACLFDAGNALIIGGTTYAVAGVVAGEQPVSHPWRFVGRRLLRSVPFMAYVCLIALALLQIRVPKPVLDFIEPVSNANAFLAMFLVGLLARIEVSAHQLKEAFGYVALRAAFAALGCALVVLFLPFGGAYRQLAMMLLWAPAGALGVTFTLWMKGDYGLAGFANMLTIVVGITAMTSFVILG